MLINGFNNLKQGIFYIVNNLIPSFIDKYGETVSIDGKESKDKAIERLYYYDNGGIKSQTITIDLPHLVLIGDHGKAIRFDNVMIVNKKNDKYEVNSLLDVYLEYNDSPVSTDLLPLYMFQSKLVVDNLNEYKTLKTMSSNMLSSLIRSFKPLLVKSEITIECSDQNILVYPILFPIFIDLVYSSFGNTQPDIIDMTKYSSYIIKLLFNILYEDKLDLIHLLSESDLSIYSELFELFSYLNIKFYAKLFYQIISSQQYLNLLE